MRKIIGKICDILKLIGGIIMSIFMVLYFLLIFLSADFSVMQTIENFANWIIYIIEFFNN